MCWKKNQEKLKLFLVNIQTALLRDNNDWNTCMLILYKYWLHERVTWEIVTRKQGEAEVDIGFRGVTISHVTISCSQ